MTFEVPLDSALNSAYRLIDVKSSVSGVDGGTVRKLLPLPQKPDSPKGNGAKTSWSSDPQQKISFE